MSSNEIAQAAPDVVATEGAESSTAVVKEDVTATSDGTQTPAAEPDEKVKQRDKRLAELAYKAREAERERKATAERVVALEAELQAAREGKGGAPRSDDFDSYEAYLDERSKWLFAQQLQQHEKKRTDDQKQAQQLEAQTRKQVRIESVMTSGAESFKDFDTTLQAIEAVANPDEIREALDVVLESDRAAELLYYLGKNPTEVAKLKQLNPLMQAREIGRLEALFESKKLTAAPPPVETLKGNGGRVTSDKAPADPAEYRKWRAKNLKR